MSRWCSDPVEVRRGDQVPAQFVWRGRRYFVRAVLAHWIESGGWWRGASVRAILTGDEVPAGGDSAVSTAELGVVPLRPASRPDGLVDRERELWRVEAGTGRPAGTGVYDLCFDWSAGDWTVARVLD